MSLNDAQETLRRRYRSALAERTQRIVELLSECRGAVAPERRQTLLGELHTLKGESRMLGLSTLAMLAHGIEDRVLGEAPDWDMLSAAVDAMCLALAEDTSEDLANELLQTACEALGLSPDPARTADEHHTSEPPAAEAGESQRRDKPAPQERWVQVEAGLVDQLCEGLAALSTSFSVHAARLPRSSSMPSPQQLRDVRSAADDIKTQLSDTLLLCLGLRLTPIESTLAGLASHVRVLAKERGKLTDVVVDSRGVRIERDLLESLREPLLHLCTNAVVHGLEPPEARGDKPERGRIELRAETSGSTVIVHVIDDGRGIDTQRLRSLAQQRGITNRSWTGPLGDYGILFEPGFSTHHQTDEVAGRGVGLDVVKRQIENIQGSIELDSVVGRGTTFSLHVPAALTQEHLVVCRVGAGLFGIPAHLVLAIQDLPEPLPKVYRSGEGTLPVRSLPDLLARDEAPGASARLLVLHLFGQRHAAWVPEVLGHFELLRRPTTPAIKAKTGFSASAQTDDGRLVLIFDARSLQNGLQKDTAPAPPAPRKQEVPARKVLLVDDSVVVRDLLSEILVGAGYETQGAEDGQKALQAIERFQPGLVISDIEMPRMDGFQLLEAIRRRTATLPVILVSARSSTADRQRAAALGANAYVAKGEFESGSLVQVVGRYYPGAP